MAEKQVMNSSFYSQEMTKSQIITAFVKKLHQKEKQILMNATTPKERADKLKNDITLLKSGSSFTSIIRPKQEFNKNSKISVLTSKMPEKRGRRRTRSPVKDDYMVDEDSVEFQLGTINPDEDTYLEPES